MLRHDETADDARTGSGPVVPAHASGSLHTQVGSLKQTVASIPRHPICRRCHFLALVATDTDRGTGSAGSTLAG
jgi:hypothetical protein